MSRKSGMAEDSSAPIPGERRGTRPYGEAEAADDIDQGKIITKPVPLGDEVGATVADDSPLAAQEPDLFSARTNELRIQTAEHALPTGFPLEPTPADTPLDQQVLLPDDGDAAAPRAIGDFDDVSGAPPLAAAAAEMHDLDNTSASPAASPLEQSHTSEDGPADGPEHTAIDGELLEKLERDKTAHGAANRDSGRGSRPRRRPTGVDDVIDASSIEAPPNVDASGVFARDDASSESVSKSVSKNDRPGSTLILEGEEHRKRLMQNGGDQSAASQLGPAFPENEEEGPRPSEAKTTARPGAAQAYRGDGPRENKSRGSGSITGDLAGEDDGWSDFQEASDDWGRSDSVSEAKPNKREKDTSEQPKRRRDTGRFKPQEREHPEPVVRLVVVSAEDKGSIEIPGDDVTLGREGDNQVVLKDPSISRKHARLSRTDDGWDLIDLQSGNGTFINGKRIDRGLVRNNDELRFGSATFKFVDTSDGLRAVDASAAPILADSDRVAFFARLRENPRLQTIVYGSSALCVALLIALAVLIVKSQGGVRPPEVFQFYLQGVEHFKQRKWDAAEGFFAAALQRDHNHQRSRRYLDAIAVERRAELALATAKDKLTVGDLSAAYEQALLASDSFFFNDEASRLLGLVAKNAEDRILLAKSALAADDKVKARGLLDGLEFYSAYRADMNELRKQAGLPAVGAKEDNILIKDMVIQQPPDKRRGAAADIASGSTVVQPARSDVPAQRSPVSDAIGILASGNIRGAADALQALPDSRDRTEALDRLNKFAAAYDEGAEELKVKRADGAIKSLKEAVNQLDRLTGRRGELSKKVCAELADALYLKGVEQYHNNQIDAAEATLKQATSYSQGHQQSANLLTKISQERQGR